MRARVATPMIDLFLNMVLMVSGILILILLVFNDKESDPAVDNINKMVIIAEWNVESEDDMDIYVRDPAGNRVWYSNKKANGMILQYDDLGVNVDKVTTATGKIVDTHINREVVNIRQLIDGIYHVNLRLFNRKGEFKGPIETTVKGVVINPYKEYIGSNEIFTTQFQERTVLRFKVFNEHVELLPVIQMSLSK